MSVVRFILAVGLLTGIVYLLIRMLIAVIKPMFWEDIKMRKYQIWIKGMIKFIEVEAEDVNVDTTNDENPNGKAFYNFTVRRNKDDEMPDITVAVFPYDSVEYVVPAKES